MKRTRKLSDNPTWGDLTVVLIVFAILDKLF